VLTAAVSIEPVKGFTKADALVLCNKPDHIAAGIAAEAVIEVGLGVDGKGWSLFFMEGTETDVVGALLTELYAVGLNDSLKVMVSFNCLYLCLRYPQAASFQKPVKRKMIDLTLKTTIYFIRYY
jgi:hypothetical protein